MNVNQNQNPEEFERIDPLDDLLGQSPLPQASPWFVAETMARIRREDKVLVKTGRSYLRWVLGFSGVGTLVAGAAALMVYTLPVPHEQPVVKQPTPEDAFSVLASFDSSTEDESDDKTL